MSFAHHGETNEQPHMHVMTVPRKETTENDLQGKRSKQPLWKVQCSHIKCTVSTSLPCDFKETKQRILWQTAAAAVVVLVLVVAVATWQFVAGVVVCVRRRTV